MAILKTALADRLTYKIMDTRNEMGLIAATEISICIHELLAKKSEINIIFAAAPSQNEVLGYLCDDNSIDWSRINAFHMDEYIGLAKDAPQGFGNFLKKAIFGRVGFKSVHYLDGSAKDSAAECRRYSSLLEKYPADIVCLGIGENGHIAFNDPEVADFDDPNAVKAVSLDEVCRMQQVNDGCFSSIDEVPKQALTLTIPTLTRARYLFCTVPAATKSKAVTRTVRDIISTDCPATIMRRHSHAVMYLDPDSGKNLL